MFSKSNQVGYCVTFFVGAYMYKTIYYMYARSNRWVSENLTNILQTWASRRWKYDWSPLSLRQVIPNMNGNLAATGMHNSETEDLEWRYCFNEIELLIFGILNDTQVKIYNMLKLLPKTY